MALCRCMPTPPGNIRIIMQAACSNPTPSALLNLLRVDGLENAAAVWGGCGAEWVALAQHRADGSWGGLGKRAKRAAAGSKVVMPRHNPVEYCAKYVPYHCITFFKVLSATQVGSSRVRMSRAEPGRAEL